MKKSHLLVALCTYCLVTFQTANAAPPPVTTFIHDIQGAGLSSPLIGQLVTIEGVVVGDFQNNAQADQGELNGFYVQEEDFDADANSATSEGIFVYAPSAQDIETGQKVQVTGEVAELTSSGGSTMTELTNVSGIIIVQSGLSLPAITDITLPLVSANDLEAYEGMRIRLPQSLVITEFFNFDRFGEIVLALPLNNETRLYQPTAIELPGSAAAMQRATNNTLSIITLDDGRLDQNPEITRHPNGAPFSLSNRFRGGDSVQNTIGVVDDTSGKYRIQPTEAASHVVVNARPAQPNSSGGNLKVASFNLHNFFITLNERGADSTEEFNRQRAKILDAIIKLDADIIGLVELENDNTAAIADLVAGLNSQAGAGIYDFINTGAIGIDAIKVGFIYKTTTVSATGIHAILDSSVDSRFIDTKNRPALAMTFTEISSSAKITVAIAHLKSKGSACDDVGDPDAGDGQGNCNGTRTNAANALTDWLASDPTGSGDPDFLIIGDLNAYDKEDPIIAIIEGSDDTPGTTDDYTDLVAAYEGELAYTYVFDGQWGYLDHALANQALMSQLAGVNIWHINSDEPDLLDYDTTFKSIGQAAIYEPNAFRSSDHDPVIVELNLDSPPITGTGTMGDFVWVDTNGNGIQNKNEPGLEDAMVELQNCSGTVLDTRMTGPLGKFSFTNLAAGDYQMQYVLPAGYHFSPTNQGGNFRFDSNANTTTGLTPCLNVMDGQFRLALDAGMVPDNPAGSGVIGDFVWEDLNGNGIQDNTEPGLAGVMIDLLDCNAGDAVVSSTMSAANGSYAFNTVAVGNFRVRFNPVPGFSYSPTGQGSWFNNSDAGAGGKSSCRSMAAGQVRNGIDAGYVPDGNGGGGGTGQTGDFVWDDLNANGVQDNMEPGLVNVMVDLYSCDGPNVFVETKMTGANGDVLFTGLGVGKYRMQFTLLPGYQFSPAGQGGNFQKDSNVNTNTGFGPCLMYGAGQARLALDAGMHQ